MYGIGNIMTSVIFDFQKTDVTILNEVKQEIFVNAQSMKKMEKYAQFKELGHYEFMSAIVRLEAKKVASIIKKCYLEENVNVIMMRENDFYINNVHDIETCQKAALAVQAKFGFELMIHVLPAYQDQNLLKILEGEKDAGKVDTKSYLISKLVCYGASKGMHRSGDTVEVPNNVKLYTFDYDCDMKNFVKEVLKSDPSYQSINPKVLWDWFREIDCLTFPIAHAHDEMKEYVSFQDGLLNMAYREKPEDVPEPKFYTFKDFKAEFDNGSKVFNGYTRMSFDCKYEDAKNGKAENWDRVWQTQVLKPKVDDDEKMEEDNDYDQETIDLIEAMIGRNQFDVAKYDKWQVSLFIQGLSDTGKSLIMKCISKLYPRNSVGIFGQGHEQTFGNAPLAEKRLIQMLDMPAKISKILDQTTWQNMVTGEGMELPQKYLDPKSCEAWTVPLMAASNNFYDFDNGSGQIARRLMIILFNVVILERNVFLEERIMKELPAILVRCVEKYSKLLKKMKEKGGGFWESAATPLVIQNKNNFDSLTVPLVAFLNDGSETKKVIKAYVQQDGKKIQDLTKYVHYQTFKTQYGIFLKQKFEDKDKKTNDLTEADTIVTRQGYQLEQVRICKNCEKIWGGDYCGECTTRGGEKEKTHKKRVYLGMISAEK